MTPDEALQALLDGNQRYVANRPRHPHQRATHRRHVAAGQHPFAVVLGCADSRVPPEIILDEGIGDLFVVRTAGHIVDDAVIGSIEFAIAHFGSPLVLVLGHERCGAVKAAADAVAQGIHERDGAAGHIGSVVEAIVPAVERVASPIDRGAMGNGPGGTVSAAVADDLLDMAVRSNVQMAVDQLRTDEPILAGAIRTGTLRIVGAHYQMEDGVIDVIVP
jgi:carbonic anhydrase